MGHAPQSPVSSIPAGGPPSDYFHRGGVCEKKAAELIRYWFGFSFVWLSSVNRSPNRC
jgi:hypothetical protein